MVDTRSAISLVVLREALDEVLPEKLGRPAAKLDAARGADPVADCENGVEVVNLDLSADLARFLGSNL